MKEPSFPFQNMLFKNARKEQKKSLKECYFDEVNDKLSVKNCVSKNLTFPKKSHQRAKTS